MRDVFYTILVVWIVYKIWNSFTRTPSKAANRNYEQRREGEVRIENRNTTSSKDNDSGDYVDYEEVKD